MDTSSNSVKVKQYNLDAGKKKQKAKKQVKQKVIQGAAKLKWSDK